MNKEQMIQELQNRNDTVVPDSNLDVAIRLALLELREKDYIKERVKKAFDLLGEVAGMDLMDRRKARYLHGAYDELFRLLKYLD